MDITGIPTHTTLLAKIESLKCIIEDFKLSVTRDIKGSLKYKLDDREICVPGFVRGNIFLSKLDEIINHNKFTANQSIGEREEQVLHFVEDGDYSEDDIMIALE